MSAGGKAVCPPVRRHLTPKEFAAELNEALGIPGFRCAEWVSRQCADKRIATNRAFKGRHLIPESELFRMLGVKEEAVR